MFHVPNYSYYFFLLSVQSTSYHSGSSLRMSCRFTEQRRCSSACWSWVVWMSGWLLRSSAMAATQSLHLKYWNGLPAGSGTGTRSIETLRYLINIKLSWVQFVHVPCDSCRWTMSEILFSIFLFFCATYNLAYGGDYYFVYIYLQAIAFLVVGIGFCGTISSNS